MIKWIKRKIEEKLGITLIARALIEAEMKIKDLEINAVNLERTILDESLAIERTLNQLKKFTKMDADLSVVERDKNTVIFTGYYNNRQWVEFIDLSNHDFNQAISYIRDMKKHSDLRVVDAPMGFDYKVFE